MRYVVVAVCSLVLFFPTYWLFHAVVGPDWGAGIAAVAMSIAFPLVALSIWPAKVRTPTVSMDRALEEGKLGMTEYDVQDAVEIEQVEDEGRHFLLSLDGRRTLYLSGQYLSDLSGDGRFPSSKIRLFWCTDTGVTFGVQCLGDRLAVSEVLPAPDVEALEADVLPNDRHVVVEDFSMAKESMRTRLESYQ